MSERPAKPWAQNAISWLLDVAASRARSGTLRKFFVTPGGAWFLCSWVFNKGDDSVGLVACYRPPTAHLARLFVTSANGDLLSPVDWEKAGAAFVAVQITPDGIRYEAFAAKPKAELELLRLSRPRAIDTDEMIRMFADAAAKQNREMAA